MARKSRDEEIVQVALADELNALRELGRVIGHHSPNGGYRSKSVGAAMKRAGCLKGWPDLEIILPCIDGQPRPPLYVEVKADGGRLSSAQKQLHAEFKSFGHTVHIIKTSCIYTALEELRAILTEHGVNVT